jgi:protein-L-isoaspartate(D-aspartate) O-methyltransferase
MRAVGISALHSSYFGRMMLLAAALGTSVAVMAQDKDAKVSDPFRQARAALVEEVAAELYTLKDEVGLSVPIMGVLAALSTVPRHEFVPESQARHAYRNRPLPIGHTQTISQPLVVALMTALADLDKSKRVLEVGTGSGYQAAILGELAGEVYTIEIIEPLGLKAAATLERLGYKNVHTRIGDGYAGWPEHAPYDAIVVTAAPDHIPNALIEQLKPGGRLVIPVGDFEQELVVVEKLADGTTRKREVIPVRFVPLTREE